MKQRRYDIDWLRAIATLAVFFFHCARFFGGGSWHLQNDQESMVATVFIGLLDLWIMPFFFLLSGVGSWYALESRSNGQYVGQRIKRLLVPLYTVGLFILVPPQLYFEVVTHEGWTRGFWESIPFYLRSLPGELVPDYFRDPSFLVPYTFTGHLWFLRYLFLISLVTLPLLRFLKTEAGQRWIDRLAAWSARRGGAILWGPAMTMAVVLLLSRGWFQAMRSWADFFVYTIFFVVGYIIPADQSFTDSIKRYGWLALALGLVGFGTEGIFLFALDYGYPGNETFSLLYVPFQIIMGITRWSWVVFLLSMGARFMNQNTGALTYSTEAVLPFYLLHQTVILIVGWFVIPWNVTILVKYVIIASVAFPLIMVIYEGLVRRFNLLRFLFGMPPKPRHPEAVASQPEMVSAS